MLIQNFDFYLWSSIFCKFNEKGFQSEKLANRFALTRYLTGIPSRFQQPCEGNSKGTRDSN